MEWNGAKFEPVQVHKGSVDDTNKTLLFLDEGSRRIVFRMGENESNVQKRIISRQFQSVAKSGIQLQNVRIGHGFTVIEHSGALNIRALMKDPERVIKELESGGTFDPTPAREQFRPQEPVELQRPPPQPIADSYVQEIEPAATTPPVQTDEALELGQLVLKHLERGRFVLVEPGPKVTVLKPEHS